MATMIQIKMLRDKGSCKMGQCYDQPEVIGKKLIDSGMAVLVVKKQEPKKSRKRKPEDNQ